MLSNIAFPNELVPRLLVPPPNAALPPAFDVLMLASIIDTHRLLHGALAPFSALVPDITAAPDEVIDNTMGLRLTMQSMRVSLPFEMDVLVGDDGRVRLAGAPPTQYTETSVMPIFHQLTVNIASNTALADG